MATTAEKLQILIEAQNDASKEIKRVQKDMQSLSKDVKSTSDSVSNSSKSMGISLRQVAGIAAGAFAINGLRNFSTEIFNTAVNLEALDTKASIVFGSFSDTVYETANEVANAMGMTSNEFVGAAADISDILVPLGFAREAAGEMSLEMTQLSGALAEWSKGQYNATQASQILAKAMVGEVEQLKTMGIVIDQSSKQFNERIKILQRDKNMTMQQARAMDIQRQIMENSTDAQTAYKQGGDQLIRTQAQLSALTRQVKETMARELTPSIKEATGQVLYMVQAVLEDEQAMAALTGAVRWAGESIAWLVNEIGGAIVRLSNLGSAVRSASNDLDNFIRKKALAVANPIREMIGKDALSMQEAATGYGRATDKVIAAQNNFNELFGAGPVQVKQYSAAVQLEIAQMASDVEESFPEYTPSSSGGGSLPAALGVSGGGSSKAVKEAKEATDAISNLTKDIADSIADYEKEKEQERQQALLDYRDTVKNDIASAFVDVGSRIEENISNIEDLNDRIKEIKDNILEISGGASQELSDRFVEVAERLKQIRESGGANTQEGFDEMQALREEQALITANTTREEIEAAKMRASESESARIIRIRDEKIAALKQEMEEAQQQIQQEKDAHAELTTFKLNMDNVYQTVFKANSLEQLSLYDQLIKKAEELSRKKSGATGARALGGPVTANMPYMVGEKGPELFVPSTSGSIVSNDKMGASISLNFGSISVGNKSDIDYLGRVVEEKVVGAFNNYLAGAI